MWFFKFHAKNYYWCELGYSHLPYSKANPLTPGCGKIQCLLQSAKQGKQAAVFRKPELLNGFQGRFLFFCRAVQHAVSLFLNQGLNLGYGSEVKNLSVMQETRFWSLGREDTLEKEMATHPSILAWRIPMVRGAWWITVHGVAKSQTRLNSWHTYDTESAES